MSPQAAPPVAGIFVVGTDTGVGKTRVAAALARTWMLLGHRVGVVKPVSTGAARGPDGFVSDDVVQLARSIGTEGSPFPPPPLDRVGPLAFEAPLAPPVAARLAGAPLEAGALVRATDDALAWWREVAGAARLVVEGVGGLLCPIAEGGYTVADLAAHLDYPLLIVAHRGLGTLNHTLLTVEVARSRGLRVAGVVLNAARAADAPEGDPAEAGNAAELARLLPGVAVLADWPHGPDWPPIPIAPEAGHWLDLALPPRPSPGAGGGTPLAGPLATPPPPTARRSVLDDPALSDDELDVPAVDLAASSTGSDEPIVAPPRPGTPAASAGFPALQLGLDLAPRAMSAAGPPAPTGDAEGDDEAHPSAWRTALLASYASAVTLALGWTLYRNRDDRRPAAAPAEIVAPEAPAPDLAPVAAGRLADRSRSVARPAPIPADRVVPVGQGLAVGSLRVEPIEVGRRDVILERVDLSGRAKKKAGGRQSIVLRVRLRNTSPDAVFAPVDPAFVRGDGQDQGDTLLELDDGRKVYTYPLAVESEWAIAGQGFGDLRPGESREVVFATTPDAPAGAERGPGTWRIKLRTGRDEDAVVGVRLGGPPPSPSGSPPK